MSAVLSPADRTAGFAVTVEPAHGFNLYHDGICYSVDGHAPGEPQAGVVLGAFLFSPGNVGKVGTSLRIPPKVALQIAQEMWQSASRLIAAQDAKEGGRA